MRQLASLEGSGEGHDEYAPYRGRIETWRNYINFVKSSGNHDFLSPIYERALITNCDN